GTNTWVLFTPDAAQEVVVDSGPHDEGHLRAVLDCVRSRGATVALSLATHHHDDHVDGVGRWQELADVPVRGGGFGRPFTEHERLMIGGLTIEAIPTPGHTSDSVSFKVPQESLLLTGDTVLGRGTSIVAYPDGNLAAYLDSLHRLRRLVG